MQRAEADFVRLEPRLRVEGLQSDTSGMIGILEAILQWRADDAFVFPPSRDFFELSMGFACGAEVEVADETKLFVEVAVTERRQQGLAEPERQGNEVWERQVHIEFSAVAFDSG